LYLEQNLKFREEQAQTTTKFLEAELKDLKGKIEILGGKISAFKEKNPGVLPELREFNQQQAVFLENELRRIDGEIQTAQTQKIYLEGLLGSGQTNKDANREMLDTSAKDPRERYHAVNEILKKLRAKFAGDHPDIQRLSKEKTELEQLLKLRKTGDMESQWKLAQLQADLASARAKYAEDHPDIKKLKTEIAQLMAEAKKGNASLSDVDLANPAQVNIITQQQQLANQINTLTQLKQKTQEKLANFHLRLEETPKIEQGYLALMRDNQNAQEKYREVMNKLMEARISEGMEQHQKGEKYTLIDPANLPETPVKPKKLLIILAGVFLGLGGGLALMLGRENLDTSIKSTTELAVLTKAPPLGIIAKITTSYDLARQHRRRWLILAATCFSLVTAILLFHFLYMDLYVLYSRLERWMTRI
jgi:succinoglycan biosynthesis transport protein ExoP